MFKALLKIWQGDSLLGSAIKAAQKMFQENNKLVEDSLDSFMNNEKFDFDVYKEDQRINHFEKDIRKKILEHLTINPKDDVAASLVLLGVIRDIERIGDYAKNYFELSKMYNKKFEGEYGDRLTRAKSDFIKKSYLTQEILIEGDAAKAKKLIDWYYQDFAPNLVELIEEIMSSGLSAQDAATFTMLSIYLKRSAAHLANIASSVSNPFHKIGFRMKDHKEIEIKS
ncbi:MAG: PhoU domain-containing protein [bacterium]